jgi:LacI family sucrose operon transcriptional repressor
MKITIKDIAEHLGVGKATVSRAVNNSGYVKKEVRERILAYVAEIGWQASSTAATLTTGKSYTVGIVVNSIGYYFNHTLLEQLNQKLFAAGYQTLLSIRHTPDALVKCRHSQVDGVIVFAPSDDMADEIRRLQQVGIRVVTIGCGWERYAPAVVSNKAGAGHQAMSLCLQAGLDRVLYLGLPRGQAIRSLDDCRNPNEKEMLSGIAAAAAERGAPFDIAADCLGANDRDRLLDVLQTRTYSACICYSVPNLTDLYSCCRELDLKIPDDMSVISIEADNFFHALNPVPTHFIHDYEHFADAAIDLLFNGDCQSADGKIVPYIFVPGESLKTNSQSR